MSKVLSANVPDEVAEVVAKYAAKFRLSMSYVTKEILIGELSLEKIKDATKP